jgi:hypothetical protein
MENSPVLLYQFRDDTFEKLYIFGIPGNLLFPAVLVQLFESFMPAEFFSQYQFNLFLDFRVSHPVP